MPLGPTEAKYMLQLRISKPPFLEDLAKIAREGGRLELQALARGRPELAPALSAESPKELDEALRQYVDRDLAEVESFAPSMHFLFLRRALWALDLDLIFAHIGRGSPRTWLADPSEFAGCPAPARFSCVLLKHLSALSSLARALASEPGPALAIASLPALARYTRHLEALGALGAEGDRPVGDLAMEGLGPLGDVGALYLHTGLAEVAKASAERRPVSRLAAEAEGVWRVAKNALYFGGGLLEMSALYAVFKYYEVLLLRAIVGRGLHVSG